MATKKETPKRHNKADERNPNTAAIRSLVHTIFIEAIRLKDPHAEAATKYVMSRYIYQDGDGTPVFYIELTEGKKCFPLSQGLKWWIKTDEASKYADKIITTDVAAVDYNRTHGEYLLAFSMIMRDKEPVQAKTIETLAAHSIAAANAYFFRAKVGRLGPVGFVPATADNLIRALADQKQNVRVNVSGEEAAARYPLSRRAFIVELQRVLDAI